jgi:Carboxypeptidase regulatory-like domain/TonB-dependent Receptor Plug Domain
MRIAVRCVMVSVFALLGVATTAFAQVQTGSLSIKATDEQGAVMPGATVSISSPLLPRAIEGVTDASGVFQVPGLAPGTYAVKLTLQGFQTFIREDIVLRQSQTITIDAPMKVGTVSEAVTVKGESPVVDTRTVGSKTNIDSALLETTPGGKDIWNILEYKAPGVVVESPDVGGNQGGLQRSMSARGTPNAQNTQLLNGVNVNDPAAQGFSMNYYIPSAFENIQVSTGAQDISVGTGGVFINMVTKGGTNVFRGQALQTYQGKDTQALNIDSSQQAAGLRPDANSSDLITNTNVQAGGPLLKNRLFYFGSFNYQATHVRVAGFPAIVPSYIKTELSDTSQLDTTDIIAGEGKLTYQPTAADRFEGYLSKQRYDKPNRDSFVNNTFTTQDSNSKELDTFVIAQLSYNRVLTDRMFVDSKVSYNNTHFPLYQKTDLEALTDNSTSTRFRNRTSSQIMFRRRAQVLANWQYYLPQFVGGRHEFKAGFDNGYTPEDVDTRRVDDVNLVFTSLPAPAPVSVQIFNSPLHQARAVMTTALYGQDSYTIGRLNIVGGLRWERVEGYLPEQTTPDSQYFPSGLVFKGVTINGVVQDFTVQKSFAAVHHDPLWHNVGPRAAATYDLTGHGRTVIKASWGKYLDQISTGTPPNPNAAINQTYVWNDLNNDLVFQPGGATWDGQKYVGGEFGALTNTSNLAVATFDRSLRRPYRNETTVSVDHELMPDFLLSVSYLHTRERDIQGTIDNSIDLWSQQYTPIGLTDPGRDGVLGTTDDLPLTVYNQNAGVVNSTRTVNDDRLAAHYNGVDIVGNKRFSKNWTMLAGYTYSHTTVQLTSLANPNAAFVNAEGESSGRRHNFKASGSYQLPHNVLFAANYRLQSGLPITRTWAVPACTASVTTNCVRQSNLTVNAEPRGSVELPWLPTLDLRGGTFFTVGGNRLEVSVDVYNVTNTNTVYNVRTNTGLANIRAAGDPAAPITQIAAFLSPTQVLAPRVARFNITYNFGGR